VGERRGEVRRVEESKVEESKVEERKVEERKVKESIDSPFLVLVAIYTLIS
jgi:hypothetical protein